MADDSDMVRLPEVTADAKGLHGVDLIQESSWDDVLSDVEAGTASDPGDLFLILKGLGTRDRESVVASADGERERVGRHGFRPTFNNLPNAESGRRI